MEKFNNCIFNIIFSIRFTNFQCDIKFSLQGMINKWISTVEALCFENTCQAYYTDWSYKVTELLLTQFPSYSYHPVAWENCASDQSIRRGEYPLHLDCFIAVSFYKSSVNNLDYFKSKYLSTFLWTLLWRTQSIKYLCYYKIQFKYFFLIKIKKTEKI